MKIIPIPLSFGLTDTIYETKMGFKTADANSAVLQFTSDSDPVGCVATLSMKNETDNSNRFSLVLEQMDVTTNPFSYTLDDEIGSSGVWIGEITLKKDLVTVCSQEFRFAIGESLQTSIMDVLIQAKSVDEMMVAIQEDVTEHLGKSDASVKQITAYVNGVVAKLLATDNTRTLQERDRVLSELARETDYQNWVEAVQTLIDTAVIDSRVQAIIDEYQSTYAQSLFSVTQQLAEIELNKADIADLPSSAYTFKGSTTFAALPTTGNTLGDVRWTTDNLLNYAWTGTAWTPIGNGAFADGSVVTKKIANGATTAPKTDFFNALNVYNPDTIVSGSYLTGATITALATACYSDKIPVKKGDIISLLNFPNTTFGTNVGSIYNANDVVVFGLTGTNKAAESITINATGAAYIRVNNTLANLFKLMVTVNQTITKFIPYGEQSLVDGVKAKQNEYNQIMSGCLTILEPNSSHIPYPDNVASMSTVKIDALNTFKNTITTTGYVGIKKVLDAWAIKTDKIKIKLKLKVVAASYPVTVAPFILAYPNKTFDSGTGTGKNGKTITVADANVVEIEQTIMFDPFVSIKGLIGGIFVASGTGDFYVNQMVLDFDYINDHNPLFGKKIVANGDSIMYGAGEVGGFVKIIAERNGMTYQNVGVSGGTITYGTKYGDNITPRHWICNTITSMDVDADYVILEGGINDYFNGIPMGAITADFDDVIDNTTFYGALESIFRQAIPRFTTAKILFVVNHNANVIASTDNGTGSARTFETYYQAILAVCKKYGIDVVDLYKNSGMITFYTAVKNTHTNKSDGVHPNLTGYKKYYVPPIEYKMREISYSV